MKVLPRHARRLHRLPVPRWCRVLQGRHHYRCAPRHPSETAPWHLLPRRRGIAPLAELPGIGARSGSALHSYSPRREAMIAFTRTASIAPGKAANAMRFGHEVAKYVKEKHGTNLEVLLPIGGNPSRIAWYCRFEGLALLQSITARLTRSRAAGFWAAIFWLANSKLATVMSWTCEYILVACG